MSPAAQYKRYGHSAWPDIRSAIVCSLFATQAGLETGVVQQVPRDDALHHLQHQRDQLGLRGQQHAQWDRRPQHPLPHRYVRDDMVDEVRHGLRHPPRSRTRGCNPRRLQLSASNLSCLHSSQRSLRKPWAKMPHSR